MKSRCSCEWTDKSVRFFTDEWKGTQKAIMLTDDLFRFSEQYQTTNLPTEIEARWRLVETSWKLCLPRQVLTVSPVPEPRNGRTLSLAS